MLRKKDTRGNKTIRRIAIKDQMCVLRLSRWYFKKSSF
jgi:hypothetical protein